MCGRFVSASPPDEIARYFDASAPEALLEPSYNVAPTNDVYAVTADGGVRRVETLHWGLVPGWAKDPKVGSRMINARAETLATKNAYKPALKRRRDRKSTRLNSSHLGISYAVFCLKKKKKIKMKSAA